MIHFFYTILFLAVVRISGVAQEVENYQVVDCGTTKVVLIEHTTSPDGRYAVGWTIRARSKKVAPVDWEAWDKREVFALIDRYPSDDEETNAPYELLNGVVDLQKRQMMVLPTNWTYYPHKNRGYLKVIWSLESEQPRYGLIQNESRFYTHNLWLVGMDGDQMKKTDLVPKLDKTVKQILKKSKPTSYEQYGVYFPLIGADYGMAGDSFFNAGSIVLLFLADIPKSLDERIEVSGALTLRLPDGKVNQVKLFPARTTTPPAEE